MPPLPLSSLSSLPTLGGITWHPWHVALLATVLCTLLYLGAHAQFERAKEDWANAFFYAPSQKPARRQRRQRWQDITWTLLGCAAAGAIASTVLYLLGPR